jgi:hypothetical protein
VSIAATPTRVDEARLVALDKSVHKQIRAQIRTAL